MECLTWQCKGTPNGEVNMSSYFSMNLSICCCRAEGPYQEVVSTVFFFPWGHIIRKKNFQVFEMSLLHYFVVTREMAVGSATFGILYNLFPNVTITARGIDSYIACHFHKHGWPNNTSQTSRGETSHNASSVKGLMMYRRWHCWLTCRSRP